MPSLWITQTTPSRVSGCSPLPAIGGGTNPSAKRTTYAGLQTWHILMTDTERVLGAYLRGEPIPESEGIKRLNEAVDEYYSEIAR